MRSALSVPLKETCLDNPALILHRYLASKAQESGNKSNPEGKRVTLEAAVTATSSNALHQMYKASFDRWSGSFEPRAPYRSERFRTQARLVIGLGAENVLEAGLRLNHPYGVPIVPGSALKGLASHYCHEIWGALHDAEAPAPITGSSSARPMTAAPSCSTIPGLSRSRFAIRCGWTSSRGIIRNGKTIRTQLQPTSIARIRYRFYRSWGHLTCVCPGRGLLKHRRNSQWRGQILRCGF